MSEITMVELLYSRKGECKVLGSHGELLRVLQTDRIRKNRDLDLTW